jgi:hypothetical protein
MCTKSAISYGMYEYLHEFEAIFRKALIRVSGALGELFDENNHRKSRIRVPLSRFKLVSFTIFQALITKKITFKRKYFTKKCFYEKRIHYKTNLLQLSTILRRP